RDLILRVNGLDTPWGRDDLAAAATAGAAGVMLPKVEAPAHVHQAQAVLAAYGAPEGLPIWCMIETPRGVLAAEAIAGASPAVVGLMVGTNDLGKALGCLQTRGRDAFLTSFGLCILAARAHGIAAIDGTHPDLSDDAGFEAACRQARDLGFDGKALIHPKTVDGANRIFAPAEADIAWARRIIAAYAEGAGGAIAVDGRLVERLHVEEAERLVALADAIAALGKA
ncbi:MAG: CoA ester lyase, partial [Alphaproteobacteria bacterium]